MLFIYVFIMFVIVSIVNIFVVWFLIEILFLFFLLFILNIDLKSVGLVVYYFFQRILSLFLFLAIIFMFNKLILLILCAKLGVFPFFYWVIIVRLKLGYIGNIFVLVFQKIPLFWLFWLLYVSDFLLLIIIGYLRLLFVVINLIFVVDFWLVLVYSSIANTRFLILAVYGHSYFVSIFIYLIIVSFVIWILKSLDSYNSMLIVVLFLLVLPPFVLFFIKVNIVVRLSFFSKIVLFMFFLDVFVLFYYFTLIFIKFLLIERRVLIYFLNFIIIFRVLFFSNCVTLIVFY